MIRLLRRVRARVRYRRFEHDVTEELEFHERMKQEALSSKGVPAGELPWRSRREMGNLTLMREQARSVWIAPPLESVWQDLRHAARHMRRAPGVFAAAILVIALAVGLASAVYSVAASVLLRPFPYAHVDRLVTVWKTVHDVDIMPLSGAEFCSLQERTTAFDAVAGVERDWYDVLGPGVAEYADAYAVTANLFTVLGVEAIAGRTFRPGEDQAGHEKVVVLDEGFWRRAFAGDPRAIGRRVRLAGSGTGAPGSDSYEIVGVVSSRFRLFYRLPMRADLYVPRVIAPAERASARNVGFFTFGRLKSGVSPATAQAQVRSLVAAIAREHASESLPKSSARVTGLHEELVGQTRPAFLLLGGAALVLLLIGCANVANLVLSDGLKRTHELSVRLSLGCSRPRLMRQLATENLALALCGGVAGVLLAFWATPLIVRLAPPSLPRVNDVSVNPGACLFAFAAALLCGLVFGVAPACLIGRRSSRVVATGAPRSDVAGSHRRLRGMLVVFETTLVVVLLAAAGLIANGLWRLSHLDLGFDPHGVLVLDINLPDRWSAKQQSLAFEQDLVSRVRHLPGVTDAAAASALPFTSGALSPVMFSRGSKSFVPAADAAIDDGYVRLLKIALKEGRPFGPQDRGSTQVAVVNQALASRFPNGRAIGQHIMVRMDEWREVVGVVRNVTEVGQIRGQLIKLPGFDRLTLPAVFVPSASSYDSFRYLLVRCTLAPAEVEHAIRKQMSAIDPEVTVRRSGLLEDRVRTVAADKQFYGLVTTLFAVFALVLTSLGLYAVLAHTVAERTREIGLRMALGAAPARIRRLFASHALALVALGLVLGLGLVAAGGRLLRSFLFEISPTDAVTLLSVAAVIIVAAGAAAYLPLHRATRIDPSETLRHL